MKSNLVHVECTAADGKRTQGPIHRDAAASMIRAFRDVQRNGGGGCSVTRVENSHVVIKTKLGFVAHLTA